MQKSGGESLMYALLHFFYLNHYKVIIEGIETLEHKNGWAKCPITHCKENCGKNPISWI